MINLEIIFSVLIGGLLTLLGALLANYLQYRSEQHRLKRELTKERITEVRRYVSTCLEFVDLVSIPTTMGPEDFGKGDFSDWLKCMEEHFDKWAALPASGSARVLFVSDQEILEELAQIDKIRLSFYWNYRELMKKGGMIQLEEKRVELREVAIKVAKRLDEILEEI